MQHKNLWSDYFLECSEWNKYQVIIHSDAGLHHQYEFNINTEVDKKSIVLQNFVKPERYKWSFYQIGVEVWKMALLKNPKTEWVQLLSDTTVPTQSCDSFFSFLQLHSKSFVPAWIDSTVNPRKPKYYSGTFYKSSQFLTLNRNDTLFLILQDEIITRKVFTSCSVNRDCVPDEHVPVNLLLWNNISFINTSLTYIAWVNPNVDEHPISYKSMNELPKYVFKDYFFARKVESS